MSKDIWKEFTAAHYADDIPFSKWALQSRGGTGVWDGHEEGRG